MIREVSRDYFVPSEIPEKFEAGTPPTAQAIGLKAAMEWLSQFDWKDIEEHENELLDYAINELSSVKGLTIQPSSHPAIQPSGCISFTLEGIHPHDLTDILGQKGICLRAGHHCAQPLHKHLGIPASTRLSVGIYNTMEEIARVRPAVEEAINLLKK